MRKGKITISRPSYADYRENISIQVSDGSSRVRFLDIEMNYADFTRAITGQSDLPIDFEVQSVDKIGMVSVNKTIKVPFPKSICGKDERKIAADEALIAYEVDGWKAYRGDCYNMHRRTSAPEGTNKNPSVDWYNISFSRFEEANQ